MGILLYICEKNEKNNNGDYMSNIDVYKEITESDMFKREKDFMQHGTTSVYDHSIMVAEMSLYIARKFNIKVNENSLVKGALLHDYFLYDWHIPDKSHKWHGFMHPTFSCRNAKRDFGLNKVEENMILSHMFPMGFAFPKYKESWILTCADKYCATKEIVSNLIYKVILNKS